MSAERVRESARALLTWAVRGRAERGTTWGEAVLAEFDQTTGGWGALRWMAGGIRVVWRERAAAARRSVPPRVRIARRLVLAVVAMVGIGILANQFLLTVRYEPSGSMDPTVQVGDRVLVDRIGYRLTDLHRGDLLIVTVGVDADSTTQAVRRLIGLPGDRIECWDGQVIRNDVVLDEPYLADGASTDCSPTVVADGTLYVLGDSRSASIDSRNSIPIREADVAGRVLIGLG